MIFPCDFKDEKIKAQVVCPRLQEHPVVDQGFEPMSARLQSLRLFHNAKLYYYVCALSSISLHLGTPPSCVVPEAPSTTEAAGPGLHAWAL